MANTNETKRTPVISCEIADDQQSLRMTCINGEALTLKRSMLSEEILNYAVMHGLKQKLIDAAAISRNPDTGKSATPGDKWEAIMAVYDRIIGASGPAAWNAARGEGTGAGNGLLFRALVRMYPAKTADQLREYLDGKTKAEQAALRLNPKVAAVIEEIKAESVKAGGVDSDSLLDELGD